MTFVKVLKNFLVLVFGNFLAVSLDEFLILHPDIFLDLIQFVLALIQIIWIYELSDERFLLQILIRGSEILHWLGDKVLERMHIVSTAKNNCNKVFEDRALGALPQALVKLVQNIKQGSWIGDDPSRVFHLSELHLHLVLDSLENGRVEQSLELEH